MQTTATIDSTTDMITMVKGTWSQSFPASDLPRWLAFFRQQQERFPVHAASYADDIRALEALLKQRGLLS
ncbi:MAG: hypothetical protein J0H53_05180 [Rhizobiales bacterium]|nr:hypothetical protein [Hyphomicrobiales bacterium]OJU35085.1 MAG: hypothetical protein BGN94_09020 [Rhizobiales bacterium 68-8]